MITVEHLNKTFKVARRNAGFTQAVKSLFNKEYEQIKALDDISFSIRDGEMVGYIGPNGAGKSSTIKILSGILTPDSGSCTIDGLIPWKDRVSHVSNIGVVFGQRSGLWWDVPVIDSFYLLKDIYRIPEQVYKDSLEELVTLLNLSTIIKTPTRQLSLGQRMRCEVAAALLHRPKILFLDEPTIGLDAVSKIAVRNFILDMNERHKTTVILTTHDMQDIEALTKRIILIGKGQILMDGDLSSMIGNGEFDRILVRPRNIVFQVLGSRIEFSRIGRLIQAFIMFVYGVKVGGIIWDFNRILTVIFMIIGGSIIFSCVFLLHASLCFFTTEGLEFVNILTDGVREHGKYPLDIYGKKVLAFCTFVIPYALVLYYPFLYLTGRNETPVFIFLPLLAILFAFPSYLFWKFGLKHYKSTGS